MVREKCGRGVKVVTTVHLMQVVPFVPSEEGDEKVDLVITEKAVHKASKMRI